MLVDIVTSAGILMLLGISLKWLHGRIGALEERHEKSLYKEVHIPLYATREDCLTVQAGFLVKIDEVKNLIIKMDEKREKAKDEYKEGQRNIENRLTAIETKLERYNGSKGT